MTDKLREIMGGLPTRVKLIFARQRPDPVANLEDSPDEVTAVFAFTEKGFGFGEFCIK